MLVHRYAVSKQSGRRMPSSHFAPVPDPPGACRQRQEQPNGRHQLRAGYGGAGCPYHTHVDSAGNEALETII